MKKDEARVASIAVLVSGGGTNLQALIDAQKRGELRSGRIRLVISNKKDAYALERARVAGIESAVVLRREFDSTEAFEGKIRSLLDESHIDLIVLAGFMSILSADFTAAYPKRIINIHPSLIPSFCGIGYYGIRVHEAAMARGVKVTGATVHYVNEIPDGGEIIMQKAVAVRHNDTPETLQKRVMRMAEWKILPVSVEKVCTLIMSENAASRKNKK
jgi:phosphoribosylglycinamide formyltransferase-1